MTHEEQIERYKSLRAIGLEASYAWAVKHFKLKGHTGCDEYLSNSIGTGVFEDQFNERKYEKDSDYFNCNAVHYTDSKRTEFSLLWRKKLPLYQNYYTTIQFWRK